MKTITPAMRAHIKQDVTTLATCWLLTRKDGQQFYATSHNQDLVYEGNTYKAETGYTRTAVANSSDLAVDNLDIQGVLDDDEISEKDLLAGLFDFADFYIFFVNWADTSPTMGEIPIRRGYLGEVKMTKRKFFQAELRGLVTALSQIIGELCSAECRADLGDERCKIPIEPDEVQRLVPYTAGQFVRVQTGTGEGQELYENLIYECTTSGTTAETSPVYTAVDGANTTDGSAVFTARPAFTRHGVVDSVDESDNQRIFTATITEPRAVDGWFNGGVVAFETGNNAGRKMEISSWTQSSGQVALFLQLAFEINVGDKFKIYPGCEKDVLTCREKFAILNSVLFGNGNVINFRGEPHVPGQDTFTSYPDAT